MRIDEIAAWIAAHQAELIAAAGALWTLVSIVVKLTPSTKDDALLHRVAQRLSVLRSANVPGILKLPGASMQRPGDPKAATLLATILALIAGLLSGCGASALDVARDTTAGGALALVAVDPVIADRYDALTLDCDSGALDADTCTERLRRLDRAERGLRSLASALTAVDLALGAYEDGRTCGLRPALEGAARSARELVVALDAAGIDVPRLVVTVANIAVTVADAPDCEPSAEDVETARAIVSGGWL